MVSFIVNVLIGLGCGLVIFPIGLWLFNLIRNTKERRRVKSLIKQGKFLIPLDPKDYDVEAWQNQKYGNINPDDYKEQLKNLNMQIFKKDLSQQVSPNKNIQGVNLNIPADFLIKTKAYMQKAKSKGLSDEQIKEQFKNKKYSQEVINKIFENA